MKIVNVILSCIVCLSLKAQEAERRCGTNHIPINAQSVHETFSSSIRENIEIPVVFHILYNDDEENLSDEVILSQLEVINRDYNKKDPLTKGLPKKFDKKVATPGITFCLATVDPFGNSTDGIIRVNTSAENIANSDLLFNGERVIKSAELGGSTAWDKELYLNIWIGARDDGITGDSTFPDDPEETETDGIVLDYQVVGFKPEEEGRFNLGRTLTHEIGHYLNVFHPHGSETGCFSDDDLIADTPDQFGPYFGKCNEEVSSCGSQDMDTNFMNFRDDECLFYFTQGQVDRMMQTLFSTRYKLISSQTCSDVRPSPSNPLKVAPILTLSQGIEIPLFAISNQQYKLSLYDTAGRKIWQTNSNQEHRYSTASLGLGSNIYILILELEGKVFSRKVFIN